MAQPLTRRTLVGAATAAALLSGCATGAPKSVASERRLVSLLSLDVRLVPTNFELPSAEAAYAASLGLDDKSFYRNVAKFIDDTLVLVDIRPSKNTGFVLTASPLRYVVTTQNATNRRAIEMAVTFQFVGDAEPLWTGRHPMQLPAEPNEKTLRAAARAWTVSVLNTLAREGVIRPIPQPRG